MGNCIPRQTWPQNRVSLLYRVQFAKSVVGCKAYSPVASSRSIISHDELIGAHLDNVGICNTPAFPAGTCFLNKRIARPL